ncbi:hypothetical protein D9M68_911830 [compost metagenome]
MNTSQSASWGLCRQSNASPSTVPINSASAERRRLRSVTRVNSWPNSMREQLGSWALISVSSAASMKASTFVRCAGPYRAIQS